MFGGSMVRDLRGRHGSWKLLHRHRVGVVWVVLGLEFGNPSMDSILRCGVPITLNTIWYSAAKIKTGEVSASQ